MTICSITECEKPHLAKSFCSKHYNRSKRGSNPHTPSQHDKRTATIDGNVAKLPLGVSARLGYAIVNKDFAYLEKHNWSLGSRGYPTAYINGKTVKLHHAVLGRPEVGYEVDHINRDKKDARTENLRFVTHYENMKNIEKLFTRTSFERN